MTSTPPPPPPQQPPYDPSYRPPTDQSPDTGPRVTGSEVRDLGRLRRSVTDRKIAGVAGGLARHFDVDPLVLRVTFVVLVFFGGAGLLLYAACWLLVPEEGSDRAPLGLDDRSRSVALAIAGGLAALALVGDSWGAFWFPWPLALIALLVVLMLSRRGPSRDHDGAFPARMEASAGPVTGPANSPVTGTGYAAPVGQHGPYPPYAAAPRPPRGPVLFWFGLALIALGIGILGVIDLAGTPVVGSAYPALVVATVGVLLLVASAFGRGGGLILLGLVAAVALAVTTVAGEWDGTQRTVTPTSSSSVLDRYEFSTGELVLDLTDVTDLDALNGRTIEVRGRVGHLEVIVPTELDTRVRAAVNGPGSIVLFGQESGGIDFSATRSFGNRLDAPDLTIVSELNFGEIEVHQ